MARSFGGAQFDGFAICINSRIELVVLGKRVTEIELRFPVARPMCEGPAVGGDGLFDLALLGEYNTESEIASGVIRTKCDDLAICGDGVVEPLFVSEHLGNSMMQFEDLMVRCDGIVGLVVCGKHARGVAREFASLLSAWIQRQVLDSGPFHCVPITM